MLSTHPISSHDIALHRHQCLYPLLLCSILHSSLSGHSSPFSSPSFIYHYQPTSPFSSYPTLYLHPFVSFHSTLLCSILHQFLQLLSLLLSYFSLQVFLRATATIRLSDLLRLMLSCSDAMVLTDKYGRIVHCNRPWVRLTGHSLTDAEGLKCDILHGSMTDSSEVRRCHGLHRLSKSSVSTVVNYRKDGLMFTSSITTTPIRGAYMSEGNECLYNIM